MLRHLKEPPERLEVPPVGTRPSASPREGIGQRLKHRAATPRLGATRTWLSW
jgi:hypothetical protein